MFYTVVPPPAMGNRGIHVFVHLLTTILHETISLYLLDGFL